MSRNAVGRSRLVLVDDDVALAELVRQLLVDEGFDVAVYGRWQDAHTAIAHHQPDVVLLDVRLGEAEHGWRVLDRLTLDPVTQAIPVILWLGVRDARPAHASAMLRQRGVYTLAKPFDVDTLLTTIAQALAAHPPLVHLDAQRAPQVAGGVVDQVALTPREREIAALLAQAYTNKQIADELVVTAGTVANHVAHILDKLGCSSRVQVAMWAVASRLVDMDTGDRRSTWVAHQQNDSAGAGQAV